jgi:FlaA1/EpsC-like NDP-sugar epimerase
MKQNKNYSISILEKNIISKNNRYQLNNKENKEIRKIVQNKKILIVGACGSIGSLFTKKIFSLNFKEIYFLDKNENALVELNRELVFLNKKKIKKTNFVCVDITSFNLDKFLFNNKIDHYYNFAAIKHVRSEESLESLKYMLKTNAVNFCPNKKNHLKLFFSISSDKAVLPQSFLGISKYFMEKKLSNFAKKHKSVFVSTVRFANVSFSEGSYLKYAKERIEKKISFGLPLNIRRYFITHDEAISLCFKSVLKKNKNKVLMPSDKIMNKEYKLSFLIKKLLYFYGYKIKFTKKVLPISKTLFPVVTSSQNLEGQKNYEEFYDKSLDKIAYDEDKSTMKINLSNNIKVNEIIQNLLKQKSKEKIIKLVQKKIVSFKTNKKTIKVSHLI